MISDVAVATLSKTGADHDAQRVIEPSTVPDNWRTTRLGNIALVRYGKSKPKETGDVPAIGSGGIYGWVGRPLVEYPTLVIGRKGAAGSVWLQEQGSWPSDTTFFLEWRSSEFDINFLYYQMLGRPLSGEHAKTTMPSLQKPDLEGYVLHMPPLGEQRAIAHALRTVQQAKEATEAVIGSTRELKKSLMNHLFTYGPVPVADAEHVPLRETNYGHVPKQWAITPLSECSRVQTGATKGRKIADSDAVEVPYLRVANVQDGYLDLAEIKNIRIARSEVARFQLQDGDVVVTEGGDFDKLGRGFIWRSHVPGAVHQNHVFAIRADTRVLLPDYLAYLVQSAYAKAYFLEVAHRTTNLACINSTKLKALPALIPTLAEQQAVASTLQAVDRKIEVEESRRLSLDALFQSLLHNLMTGKVRVGDLAMTGVG